MLVRPSFRRALPVMVMAVSLLAANAATARDANYNDRNCLFKSSVIQKGGEQPRRGIEQTSNVKQNCSYSQMHEARNNGSYNNRMDSSTRVDNRGRVVPNTGY